jgi:hypothetical protein
MQLGIVCCVIADSCALCNQVLRPTGSDCRLQGVKPSGSDTPSTDTVGEQLASFEKHTRHFLVSPSNDKYTTFRCCSVRITSCVILTGIWHHVFDSSDKIKEIWFLRQLSHDELESKASIRLYTAACRDSL